jgi:hypothetical protein
MGSEGRRSSRAKEEGKSLKKKGSEKGVMAWWRAVCGWLAFIGFFRSFVSASVPAESPSFRSCLSADARRETPYQSIEGTCVLFIQALLGRITD